MKYLMDILYIFLALIFALMIPGCDMLGHNKYGTIVLDGDLSDWRMQDCIDYHAWEKKKECRLYGRYVDNVYLIALKSEIGAIDAATTLWLNTDQDKSTGYQIFGDAGGAEYRVEFGADKRPCLYRGGETKQAIADPLHHAFSDDNRVVELAIPGDLLGDAGQGINLLIDINDRIFMPINFSAKQYIFPTKQLPSRTDFGKRVGIVFSRTSAKKFFHEKAYSKLFMAMQHQAMMAGIPFDVLEEDDITEIANIVNYDALLFPYFRNLPKDKLRAVMDTLMTAIHRYHIGLIACGDFMTHDESNTPFPGDPYHNLKKLFGLYRSGGDGPVSITVRATGSEHAVMDDYDDNDIILTQKSGWYGSFKGIPGQSIDVLVTQDVDRISYNGVVATENGGRNIHFSTTELMGYTNLVWKALQWVVFGDQTAVGLQMSRHKSIFLARNDIDLSQFIDDVPRDRDALHSLLSDWKDSYNFVGTFFINIGNDPKNKRYTDWGLSAPFYLGSILAFGNEIGTHSYTHPMNVNLLSKEALEFEFNQSKKIISERLGIEVIGGAVPGNPESLSVTKVLDKYLSYLSGEFSNVGYGYPGAFGYLTPDYRMIYFSPSMYPDYTMAEWFKWSAAQAQEAWLKQYARLIRHANVPIIHWLWHDYGLLENNAYSLQMYSSIIQRAYKTGCEFATMADIFHRIKRFQDASLTVSDRDGLTVKVAGQDLGQFSLKVQAGQMIKKVDNWYAYNDNIFFLPRNGGEYTIHLGAPTENVTRIISLPMRAELISVSGDGNNLEFSFRGRGRVEVALSDPDRIIDIQGADLTRKSGRRLELLFNTPGEHVGRIVAK